MSPQTRSLLLGGLLPVVAYTVLEEVYGVLWGLAAGMAIGLGEILWEWRRHGRVDSITWIGNGLLLVMGGIALATREGLWFRLQPALLEGLMGGGLIVSVILGKPFLTLLAAKQGLWERIPADRRPLLESRFRGLTLRIALFLLAHAGLAAWAALHWSTRAWALLKGVGFTASFVLYLGLEVLWLRRGQTASPSRC